MLQQSRTLRTLTSVAIVLALTCSVFAGGAYSKQKDIVDTAAKAGTFKTLVAAVQAAGLVDTLKGDGPFTVFAPTDDAFAKLPKGTLETLLKPENKQLLVSILTYHVVPGKVMSGDVVKLTHATTVNGQRIDITVTDAGVKVDGANVEKTDIKCSNGVIHVIDTVIMPSSADIVATATQAGSFATLVAAVKAAGLVETLKGDGPFTVFAPTDAAFAKLPEGTVASLLKPENKDKLVAVLTYHVVPARVFSDAALEAGTAQTVQGSDVHITATDDGAKVNESNLITLDIDASNGVIHVIDTVLLPPSEDKKQASAAVEMIEMAIRRGAPMFNAGHHEACAAVYEVAAYGVMALAHDQMTNTRRDEMTGFMRKAQHTHSMSRRAWMLRHALDTAHASLQN